MDEYVDRADHIDHIYMTTFISSFSCSTFEEQDAFIQETYRARVAEELGSYEPEDEKYLERRLEYLRKRVSEEKKKSKWYRRKKFWI